MRLKQIAYGVFLALIPIVGIILLFLPSDFFDHGESICLSVLLLNKQCYACGMTRGIMHLIHFDFENAWNFNKLTLIVFPLMCYVYGKEVYEYWVKNIKKEG